MRYVREIEDGGRWIVGDAIDAGPGWNIPVGEIWRLGNEAIGTEIAPPEPASVPETITQSQMRRWLWTNRTVRDADVRAIIAALPAAQQEPALIEWEYADGIHRVHPLVASLGAALGMDAAALDQAFREASTL